jgi:hypothetical protein
MCFGLSAFLKYLCTHSTLLPLIIESTQNKSTINFVNLPYFKKFSFYRYMYTLLYENEHSVQVYVIHTVNFLTRN